MNRYIDLLFFNYHVIAKVAVSWVQIPLANVAYENTIYSPNMYSYLKSLGHLVNQSTVLQ